VAIRLESGKKAVFFQQEKRKREGGSPVKGLLIPHLSGKGKMSSAIYQKKSVTTSSEVEEEEALTTLDKKRVNKGVARQFPRGKRWGWGGKEPWTKKGFR